MPSFLNSKQAQAEENSLLDENAALKARIEQQDLLIDALRSQVAEQAVQIASLEVESRVWASMAARKTEVTGVERDSDG